MMWREDGLLEAILQKLSCIDERLERIEQSEQRQIGLLEQLVRLQTPNLPQTIGGSIRVEN